MALDADTTRSRRAFVIAAIGGLGGLLAGRLGSPSPARAASGDALILGASNSAGSGNTSLTTSSSGTALYVTQNGSGTGIRANAVGADSIGGFFTANNGTGVSGVTGRANAYGVYAANDNATTGSGAALRANGKQNHGVAASTAAATRAVAAVLGTASAGGLAAKLTASKRVAEVRQVGPDAEPVLVLTSDTTGATTDPDPGTPGAILVGTDAIAGIAVHAKNTSVEGCQAIYARADGGNVAAIWGANYSGEATGGAGILGETDSPDGFGVWGTGPVGVRGVTNGPFEQNAGVSGEGPVGVVGTSSPRFGQPAVGVLGIAHDPSAYAGRFDGTVALSSNLELAPVAGDPSPIANRVLLYAVSSGGKLTLRTMWPNGGTVDLASEPAG